MSLVEEKLPAFLEMERSEKRLAAFPGMVVSSRVEDSNSLMQELAGEIHPLAARDGGHVVVKTAASAADPEN